MQRTAIASLPFYLATDMSFSHGKSHSSLATRNPFEQPVTYRLRNWVILALEYAAAIQQVLCGCCSAHAMEASLYFYPLSIELFAEGPQQDFSRLLGR